MCVDVGPVRFALYRTEQSTTYLDSLMLSLKPHNRWINKIVFTATQSNKQTVKQPKTYATDTCYCFNSVSVQKPERGMSFRYAERKLQEGRTEPNHNLNRSHQSREKTKVPDDMHTRISANLEYGGDYSNRHSKETFWQR
jgi:hypothetical protein